MNVIDMYAGTGSAVKAFYDAGDDVVFIENDADLCAELRENYPRARVLEMDAKAFAKDPWKYLPAHWDDVHVMFIGTPCTAFSPAGKGSQKVGSSKNAQRPRWLHAHVDKHVEQIPQRKAREHAQRYGEVPFFGPRFPNDHTARLGCSLALAGLTAVYKLYPRFWWLENPMGGLMTMRFMESPAVDRFAGMSVTRTRITHCQYDLDAPLEKRRMKPTILWGRWPYAWVPREPCSNGDDCHVAAPRGARTGTQGLKNAKERGRVPYSLGVEMRASILAVKMAA